MIFIIAVLALIAGTVLLLWGADWFIDSVRDLALDLGISILLLGILLAGLEPEEMLVSALASAQGAGALALGDVIGTNIIIVTLALGLSALLAPILIDRSVRRQALIATLISLPPIVLLVLGPITRIAGAVLLLLFVGYTILLLRTDRKAIQRIIDDDDDDDDDDKLKKVSPSHAQFAAGKVKEDAASFDEADTLSLPVSSTKNAPRKPRPRWQLIAMICAGLLAMALGGPLIVYGGVQLASVLGLGQDIVGSTIVALGTGAELIALGIAAARKRQTDVLIGGILGSFAYNLLVTLGLAAVVRPLPVLPAVLRLALWFMIASHLILLLLVLRGKIGRIIGVILVLIYVAFLATAIITGIVVAL